MSNMHATVKGSVIETIQQVADREKAARELQERRMKLKQKREAKKLKVKNEKQEYDREREYLLDSLRK